MISIKMKKNKSQIIIYQTKIEKTKFDVRFQRVLKLEYSYYFKEFLFLYVLRFKSKNQNFI